MLGVHIFFAMIVALYHLVSNVYTREIIVKSYILRQALIFTKNVQKEWHIIIEIYM